MDIVHLFLGFAGRIGRSRFWIALLILGAAEIAVMLMLGVPFIPKDMNPWPVRVKEFAVQLIFLYPTAAVTIKRLHDRDYASVHVLWLLGTVLVILITNLLGITGDPNNPAWLDYVLAFLAAVICLAFLIDLGFRRGTMGDNRFGPDPLGGRDAQQGDGR